MTKEATTDREKKKGGGGFNGGKIKCKFSSIMKTDGVRKNSAPLCDYRKAKAAGLSSSLFI
jgi:hypothetical protein